MFQDLGDIDPGLLQGLQKLEAYDGGDEEDVFGVDFRVRKSARELKKLEKQTSPGIYYTSDKYPEPPAYFLFDSDLVASSGNIC